MSGAATVADGRADRRWVRKAELFQAGACGRLYIGPAAEGRQLVPHLQHGEEVARLDKEGPAVGSRGPGWLGGGHASRGEKARVNDLLDLGSGGGVPGGLR